MCRYSLEAFGDGRVCPECGVEVDFDLVQSTAFADAVTKTRAWCMAGLVCYPIVGFVYWFDLLIRIALKRSYGSGFIEACEYESFLFRVLVIIAPIALIWGWRRNASEIIYRRALRHPKRDPHMLVRACVVSVFAFVGAIPVFVFMWRLLTAMYF